MVNKEPDKVPVVTTLPALMFPTIPAPPATTNAPVVVDDDGVILDIFAIPLTFAFPKTVTFVNVPTDVILGCIAVVNVPVSNVPNTLPAITFPPALIFPDTPIPPVVTIAPVVVDVETVKLLIFAIPPILEFPKTVKFVNVPTDVIFG